MSDIGGLHYIHERIDQLIRQTALEVGLLQIAQEPHPLSRETQERWIAQAYNRFWAADDAAADNHRRQYRER